MRDLKSNIKVTKSLAPAARTTSANGTGVDLRGFNSAVVVFHCGALTDGTHTPKVQESDDDSTYTDVDSSEQDGTLVAMTANGVQTVGYIGNKRYIRPVITVTGSPSTGAVASVEVIAGHPALAPTT